MAVFTQLNETQVAGMLENYDLGELIKLTPIQSGTENTNYFIQMQHGDAHEKSSKEYLLTIFERLSVKDLPFYLDFTAYLAEKGVSVPAPIIKKPKNSENHHKINFNNNNNNNNNNDCIYLNEGININHVNNYNNNYKTIIDKPWAVVEKLTGQSVMQAHAVHVAQVAQNLAKMHVVGQDYTPRQENLRGMAWWHATIPQIYNYLDIKTANLLAAEFSTQQTFYQSALYQNLPKSIAHCDLFRDNVMFKPLDLTTDAGELAFKNFEPYYKDLDVSRAIQLSGFFDFYFAAYETMLFDICITINDWCSTVDHQIDQALCAIFFHEYQKVRPLNAAEKEALPLMFRAAALRFWVSRLFDWHMPRQASMFKPHPPERFEMILRYHLNTKVEVV